MKRLKFLEILLISLKEKKAKRIPLHPKRTIILGKNSTGKSCLLKSLYYTFGAEPTVMHPNWKGANVISLVKFEISSETFSVLRNGNSFSVFDQNNSRLLNTYEMMKLSEFLAELFEFKFKQPEKDGQDALPPAFIFAPFYCDQDNSWVRNWHPFRMRSALNLRRDIINYHTGLRPNEYYETKNEMRIIQAAIDEIDKDRKIVLSLLKNLKEKLALISFSVSIETFQEELKQLLIECDDIKKKQNKHKKKLSNLYEGKLTIDIQIDLTKKALKETRGDFSFAVENLDDTVDCPTCGAGYNNSFAERFELAQDEFRLMELLAELQNDSSEIEKVINKTNDNFKLENESFIKAEALLQQKKGEIKLKDLIESEGKREMRVLFEKEIKGYEKLLGEKVVLHRELEEKLKTFTDKERQEEILTLYRNLMKKFLYALNVFSLRQESYKAITTSVKESGSAAPRALMAYYYSILHLMNSYGSSTYCPIVIDSPNQQGQDSENLPKLLNFINEYQPKNSQLILGLEDTCGVDFNAEVIELKEREHLLQAGDYEGVYSEMRVFLDKSLM